MDLIDVWSAAADHLLDAIKHMKEHLGKPGEGLAKIDHDKALEAYNEASENLPDA